MLQVLIWQKIRYKLIEDQSARRNSKWGTFLTYSQFSGWWWWVKAWPLQFQGPIGDLLVRIYLLREGPCKWRNPFKTLYSLTMAQPIKSKTTLYIFVTIKTRKRNTKRINSNFRKSLFFCLINLKVGRCKLSLPSRVSLVYHI